ncbi:MAG: SUMF1/EgtB/PvdO family nonheme iron enzyme [Deltaproteobacteria bacterium]|nr:SUMF1/EgtB/PvdO family nonheme iron enzyme [Deltaproteobacteria bacterium]
MRPHVSIVAIAILIGCACVPDRDVDDDAALHWIDVSGGGFVMGCAALDVECAEDELPAREVSVSAFRMLATEVTLLQYLHVAGNNPNTFNDCSRCPVEGVDWFAADAFCRAIGARLPTEAEWEFAARAGSDMTWPCGEDPACLDEIAWHAGNAGGATHPVATKAANAWGFFDLPGNVDEWTSDWYAPLADIDETSDPTGADEGVWRVIKGGSWLVGEAWHLRPSYRGFGVDLAPNFAASHVGFRCAMSISDENTRSE